MADDDVDPQETLLRGLLRLPAELDLQSGRPHQDKDDFLRRLRYMNDGPENGLSVFRRTKYPTNEAFYDRIGSKKAMGTAECKLIELTSKGIQYVVTGEEHDHISLRCSDCNMASKPEICKPANAASFSECPFFDKLDPYDLNSTFKETAPPTLRKPVERPPEPLTKEKQ